MSTEYTQLLDATIAHLEALKERGVSWIPVRRETLLSVQASPAKPVHKAVSRPASPIESRDTVPVVRSNPVVLPENPSAPAPAPRLAPTPVRSEAALSRWSKAVSPMRPVVPVTPSRVAVALPPPLPPDERARAMALLREEALACTRCPHLVGSRSSVVFGVGDLQARILFVGEAPGAEEDLSGEPFVGKAGELLTKIITAMGLGRDSVFIANILKCRPDTPGLASGNRKPRPEEMATCIPWLERQIDLVQPQVMVALGATAVEGLLGKGAAGITQLRGSWQDYRGIPLMPTYHPAYLLRNQALTEKRKVWEDMLQVLERAGYPISAKQRGFFVS